MFRDPVRTAPLRFRRHRRRAPSEGQPRRFGALLGVDTSGCRTFESPKGVLPDDCRPHESILFADAPVAPRASEFAEGGKQLPVNSGAPYEGMLAGDRTEAGSATR